MESDNRIKLKLYKGELTNKKELIGILQNSFSQVENWSDENIIIYGYKLWGIKLPQKLKGYFSFCLCDCMENLFFGARDRFGSVPFYYSFNEKNDLIVSDSIEEIIIHKGTKDELNINALSLYLSLSYIPGEETMFKSIKKLMPNSYMTVKNGRIQIKKYNEFIIDSVNIVSDFDYKHKIKNIIKRNINNIDNENAVMFLSSGVDSNYLYSISECKNACSISFYDNELSEGAIACENARKYGKESSNLIIDINQYKQGIGECIRNMEQPIGSASAVPFMLACKEASKKYKYIITGEGADELFAGYEIYKMYNQFSKKIPYLGKVFLYSEKEKKALCKDIEMGSNDALYIVHKLCPFDEENMLQHMMNVDLKLWLEADSLTNTYKMSKAYGVVAKTPYINEELYEIAYSMPNKYKITDWNKQILREIAVETVSDEIAYIRKKGFITPIRKWMKEDWYDDIYRTIVNNNACQKLFNIDYVIDILNSFKYGDEKLWRKIWALYSFSYWYMLYEKYLYIS